MIGGRTRPHGSEQAAPRVSHATADAVEIEAQTYAGIQQRASQLVQRKLARSRLCEHTFGDEMPQHSV